MLTPIELHQKRERKELRRRKLKSRWGILGHRHTHSRLQKSAEEKLIERKTMLAHTIAAQQMAAVQPKKPGMFRSIVNRIFGRGA